MGRTLKAAVLSMPTIKRPDMNIMSVTGSLTRKLSANPYDLVQHFVERTGGDGYFLPVPYLAETFQEKEIFLNQKGIQELLSKAQDAELYLLGLGSLIKDGHLMQFGMMNDDERKHLEENNVVADLMGHFITQSGEIYREGFADHAVTFALEKIKNKHVVVIAAGKSKADALLACLKTGIIKDLLIDESLASELLKKLGAA
jgi:DNA-binding transcriptional regulator LsrR (DeoR family)